MSFVCSQVNALLSSLEIDSDIRARGPVPGRLRELEEYWNESQSMRPVPNPADGWVTEFAQHPIGHGDPNTWVQSFEKEHGANGWASEFEHVRELCSLACIFMTNIIYCKWKSRGRNSLSHKPRSTAFYYF